MGHTKKYIEKAFKVSLKSNFYWAKSSLNESLNAEKLKNSRNSLLKNT
jgi:hypothetical protein